MKGETNSKIIVLAFLAAWVVAVPATPSRADSARMAEVRLVSDSRQIAPGQKFRLGLLFVISADSHIYWRNPGDAGLATMVEWELPEGFVAGPLFWPAPVRLEEPGDLSVNAYMDSVLLFSWVQAPPRLETGEVLLGVKAEWLACRKICVQESDSTCLTLAAGQAREAGPDYPLFESFAARVPQPAESGRQARGTFRWIESGGDPETRTGVLVMDLTDQSLRLLNHDGAAAFFGDPSADVTCESFHLDAAHSSSGRLVMHLRVRALRGRQWPDNWGGVLSAQALGTDGDTLTLALQYLLPGKTEMNP